MPMMAKPIEIKKVDPIGKNKNRKLVQLVPMFSKDTIRIRTVKRIDPAKKNAFIGEFYH